MARIELLVGLNLLLRRAAAGQAGAGVGDILEDFGFVLGEALHGVHQVGNQVGAALQRHVHVGPLSWSPLRAGSPGRCGCRRTCRRPAPPAGPAPQSQSGQSSRILSYFSRRSTASITVSMAAQVSGQHGERVHLLRLDARLAHIQQFLKRRRIDAETLRRPAAPPRASAAAPPRHGAAARGGRARKKWTPNRAAGGAAGSASASMPQAFWRSRSSLARRSCSTWAR